MRKERKDLVFYLSKAEQNHQKADAAASLLMKAAFEAVARDRWGGCGWVRQLDPSLVSNGRD